VVTVITDTVPVPTARRSVPAIRIATICENGTAPITPLVEAAVK
jgi:hypothetical protein